MDFDSISFKGINRPYQKRVLDNLNSYLSDSKIHIVAPSGSGKTTLGLQIIKKLNKRCLVLTPSIAIREQWLNRFNNDFLNSSNLISNEFNDDALIICITYQSLHQAIKKGKDNEDEEKEIDYSTFNLKDFLKRNNIQTICLDECHHLKNDWWKSLELLTSYIENPYIISLTATPPYDSSMQEFDKYIDLCGPIDDEIFPLELIKDNCICSHQDYVYFSYPLKKEEESILKLYSNGIKVYAKYKNNQQLIDLVLSNKHLKEYYNLRNLYYEDDLYFQAIMTFLIENKQKVPFFIKLLLKNKKFDIEKMQILLQKILFDDTLSYEIDKTFLTSLKREISALGVVNNRKVCIVHDERCNQIMSMSLSKLNSIETIVKNEYTTLKDNIHCLILTDYIKSNTISLINSNAKIDDFGTIPIFEHLRRCNIDGISLCCLTGTICIIPKNCCIYLSDEFEYKEINNSNYVSLKINNTNKKKIVLLLTDFFEKNLFNVLIGTKALLGEGWDSPIINTLIIASFINSYVSSNQIRGRAIRIDKNYPNKVANIWHLVCLNPYDFNYSTDYYALKKRFQTFVGIDTNNNLIENGLERLNIVNIPKNVDDINNLNNYMLKESKDKDKVKKAWITCINSATDISSLNKITSVSNKRLKKEYSFFASLTNILLSAIASFINYGLLKNLLRSNILSIISILIYLVVQIFIAIAFIKNFLTFIHLSKPHRKLKILGYVILNALKKAKIIQSSNIKIKVFNDKNNFSNIYLLNASTYEQDIFSTAIKQLLNDVSEARYILALPKHFFQFEYYVVPDAFKKNKDLVKIFKKEFYKFIGPAEAIFTKNKQNRLKVIKSRRVYEIKYSNIEIFTKNKLYNKK